MLQFLPMAVGALGGALTNKDPLTGALTGAGMGAVTGGLGGLGGAAASAPGAAGNTALGFGSLSDTAAQALPATAASTGVPGIDAIGFGSMAKTAEPAGGLLSPTNLKTVSDMAGIAGKMGLMDSPQGPVAQSAGIPGRQADFTGLLSAARGNQMSGAEKLMAQRAARRG